MTLTVSQTFVNSDPLTVTTDCQDACVHVGLVTVTNHRFSSCGSLSPGLIMHLFYEAPWSTCLTVRTPDLWSVSWHVCVPQTPLCTPQCLRPIRMRAWTPPACPPTWDTDVRWWTESFMCTQRRARWTCERLFPLSKNDLEKQIVGYINSHTVHVSDVSNCGIWTLWYCYIYSSGAQSWTSLTQTSKSTLLTWMLWWPLSSMDQCKYM